MLKSEGEVLEWICVTWKFPWTWNKPQQNYQRELNGCVYSSSFTLNLLLLINFFVFFFWKRLSTGYKGPRIPKTQLSTLARSFQPALSLPPTNFPSWACPSSDFWANLEHKHWVRWILPAVEVVMRIRMREEANEESLSNNRAVSPAKPAKEIKKNQPGSMSVQEEREVVFSKKKLYMSPEDQCMFPLIPTAGSKQRNPEIEGKKNPSHLKKKDQTKA